MRPRLLICYHNGVQFQLRLMSVASIALMCSVKPLECWDGNELSKCETNNKRTQWPKLHGKLFEELSLLWILKRKKGKIKLAAHMRELWYHASLLASWLIRWFLPSKDYKSIIFSDFAWNEVRSLCFIAWLKVGFNSTATICQTPILQLKDTMDHIQSSLIMLLPQIKVFIFRNAPLHFLWCQLSCIS